MLDVSSPISMKKICTRTQHTTTLFLWGFIYTRVHYRTNVFLLLWIVLQNFGEKGDLISRCRLVSGM